MTKLQTIDKFISDTKVILSLEESVIPTNNLFYTSQLIKYYTPSIPLQVLGQFINKISTLHGITEKNIGELEFNAIPKYKGNGELDDPDEYADADLQELNYLYQYLGYITTLESIFNQELFDRGIA